MEFGLVVMTVVTAWFAVLGAAAGWAAMTGRAEDVEADELSRRVFGATKWATLLVGVPGAVALLMWLSSNTRKDDFGTLSFVTVVAGGFFLLLSYLASIVLGLVGCAIVKRMPALMAAGVMFAVFVAMPGLSLASTGAQYLAQRARR